MMEKPQIHPSFIAVGATRHPSASEWDQTSGILAFAAGRTIAIWQPDSARQPSVSATLKGHTDKVNTLCFVPGRPIGDEVILSAGVDKIVYIWRKSSSQDGLFELVGKLDAHSGSINAIKAIAGKDEDSSIFVTASSDGTVKVWKLEGIAHNNGNDKPSVNTVPVYEINTKPKYFPLSIAITPLDSGYILATAGSMNGIQIYTSSSDLQFKSVATMTGHENWIRSLSFVTEPQSQDLMLASASQDRFIRLWRVHQGTDVVAQSAASKDPSMGRILSNKAHRWILNSQDYTMTFEALLVGHEDWVYTAEWRVSPTEKLQLLTSSADNSLSIWEPEEESGIWTCIARLGEISTTKGSSTATGSAGGFWAGLWSPDGQTVVSLGKTGCWRKWSYDEKEDRWVQLVSISGHTRDTTGIAWSTDGKYLLSTRSSWYEFSRAQIHGYDINCISSLGPTQFVTGADEKLLRVFDQPKPIAQLLSNLCGIQQEVQIINAMPETASIPVLSLSNKAVTTIENDEEESPSNTETIASLPHPPLEDHLSRHTLWPETEKLYGHGYEISTLATSNHAPYLIATACRASSTDHAVIRVYETVSWRQLKPPLTHHSLTVLRMSFSPDDKYLLSVGRDRQFAIFERTEEDGQPNFKLHSVVPKGHSRVIWDGKWAPVEAGRVVATASRDKTVKIWRLDMDKKEWGCCSSLKFDEPVTAVDFCSEITNGSLFLAVGLESGGLFIYQAKLQDIQDWSLLEKMDERYTPDKTVTEISWRPKQKVGDEGSNALEFAVASEDASVRLYTVSL